MKSLSEIINEPNLIVEIAEEFGLKDIRIYSAIEPYEENALNLIVDLKDNIPLSNIHPFQLELENRLVCRVNVTSKKLIDAYKFSLIEQNIASITDKKSVDELIKDVKDIKLNPPGSYDPVTGSSPLYNDVSFIREVYLQRPATASAINQLIENLAVQQIKEQINNLTNLSEINEIIDHLINRKEDLEKRLSIITHKTL